MENMLFCLCLFVQRVLTLKRAVFTQFELALNILFIFIRGIVFSLALAALKSNDFNRCLFARHSFTPYNRFLKASERDRTADLNLTMVALCRLSYRGGFRDFCQAYQNASSLSTPCTLI